MATTSRAPKTTTIADDTTQDKPQSTDAGDAPADTWDPQERVSSTDLIDKAAAAEAGYQTVNAVVPVDPIPEAEEPENGGRTESYKVINPQGEEVTVTHNIDTGKTTVAK